MLTELLEDTLRYDDYNRKVHRPVTPERASLRGELLNAHGILIVGRKTAEHTLIPDDVNVHLIRVDGPLATFGHTRSHYATVHEVRITDVDSADAITDDQVEHLVKNVFPAIAQEQMDGTVFMFHCFMGQQRSATVALAFARYIGDMRAFALIEANDLYVPHMAVYGKILTNWAHQTNWRQTMKNNNRLGKQQQAVLDLMIDGQSRTLRDINVATGAPEASVSARLRDLRASGYTVERSRVPGHKNLFLYRVVTPKKRRAKAVDVSSSNFNDSVW